MSSATERLRAMLDERWVEHWDTEGITEYRGEYGRIVRCYSRLEPITLDVAIIAAPPEQAIEATLGRGECELVHTRDKPRSKAPTLTCSECGWWTDRINDEWRYCPRCGKRVKA